MAYVRVRPLRRVEFDVLIEQGVFTEDDRIQLLEGELIELSPQGVRHASVIEALNERLMPALAGQARVRVQLPIAAGELSEPEPDLAVVSPDEPRDRQPERALLVIEVADASLRLDLGRKARIYAGIGVPTYWVIDIAREQIHVHTNPAGGAYRTIDVAGRDDELEACGHRLRLRDLL